MKTVSFLRHAKSSWDNQGLRDFDRPLNNRGFRDTPDMAQRLLERQFNPDLILASTAKRALTTAEILAEAMDYQGDFVTTGELYHSSTTTILGLIHELDDKYDHVLIVAHNPGIGMIASMLSGQALDFPTCAIASIDYDCLSWQEIEGRGELIFYDYPKNR